MGKVVFEDWQDEYGRNVEKEFWQILIKGFERSVVPSKGNVETYLCPETILVGIIELSWSKIRDQYSLERFKNTYEPFGDFTETNSSEYARIIRNTPKLKCYLDNLIKNNKTVGVLNFYNNTDHVIHPLVKTIGERLKTEARNDFGLSVMDLLEKAVKSDSIVTVKELFEYAIDVIEDPSKLNVVTAPKQHLTSMIELRKGIGDKIKGQDNAIRKFMEGYFEGRLTSGSKEGPESTFLFVGPPGVGKTHLANTFAELLAKPYRVFQMNEYANENGFHGLVGFEQTWKDSAPGVLTDFVRRNPDAVLVFDEIEKAHVNTLRQFLSVLEGGFLRDLYFDRDVSFKKTICIFTTNAGREFYEDDRDRLVSSIPDETIIDSMKKEKDYNGNPVMPTEFLSRLAKGYLIGFDHLDPVKLLPIIRDGMEKGSKIIEDRLKITLNYDPVLLSQIFMFTHGTQLDARVASSRSRTYLTTMIHQVMDQENNKRHAEMIANGNGADDSCEDELKNCIVKITIDADDPIVKRYLIPDRKRNIIFIARLGTRATIFGNNPADAPFVDVDDWYDSDDEEKKKKIRNILDTRDIDAVLIDPFFGMNSEEGTYEGVLNTSSRAMELLKWIMDIPGIPSVYILFTELHQELMFNQADIDSLKKFGVSGFVDSTYDSISELSLELFLSKKLSGLMSKGRILSHSVEYKKEGDEFVVTLRKFNEKTSMDTEAAGVFVNETSGLAQNGFDKVIGAENAKQVMRNFVRFLKDPVEYQKSGQSVSKGILLYGPPGTGKTMLAKALASEADCPFISVSGADITSEKRLGAVKDDKVHDIAGLFRIARKYAPSVLFIDEIDAFAKEREINTPEHVSIINKLLTEMDGFSEHRDKPVFVVAATNMGDAPGIGGNRIYLDKALLRRFTSRVYVDLPDEMERLEFLQMRKEKLTGKKYGLDGFDDDALEEVSRVTMAASLAEIENAITIAQGKAAEADAPSLSKQLLIDSFEEMKYGEKIKNIDDHIKTTAYHEAGHAFMSFQAEERFWPEYASVVGRGNFLGVVHRREDTGHDLTRRQLIDHIRISLGGRAAEIVFNGKEEGISAGAENDLLKATGYAWDMICIYGMEEGFMMSMPVNMATILAGPLSDKYTSKVNEILERELKYTTEVIEKNKDDVKKLGDELLEKSRLNMEEMKGILGL